jgi:hypothetical protein
VAGAALLSIGLSQLFIDTPENEKLRFTSRPIQKRERQVASAGQNKQMPMPNILHQACAQGDARACVGLIQNKVKFNLSETHTTYYARRACELGETSHCLAK